MKTNPSPINVALTPLLMESCPNSGPMVLSSSMCMGAGRAPTRSTRARSFDSSTLKRPVITASPEGIASLMRGADCTLPSRTIASLLPTLLAVISANFFAPSELNCRATSGSLNWLWSKRIEALVSAAPVKAAFFSSRRPSLSSRMYFNS